MPSISSSPQEEVGQSHTLTYHASQEAVDYPGLTRARMYIRIDIFRMYPA